VTRVCTFDESQPWLVFISPIYISSHIFGENCQGLTLTILCVRGRDIWWRFVDRFLYFSTAFGYSDAQLSPMEAYFFHSMERAGKSSLVINYFLYGERLSVGKGA
jgi:hypothetical protein